MNRASLRAVALTSLTIFALASSAIAQPANPLDPKKPGQTNPGQAGMDAPAVNLQKIFVPEFIKPGATFYYDERSGQFHQNSDQLNTGSVAVARYTVVGVTESQVYLVRTSYLNRNGVLVYSTSSLLPINQMQVVGGATIWTDIRVVDGMTPNKDLTITNAPLTLGGAQYDCTTMDRVTRDASARQFWDRGTGLLLAAQLATGRVLGKDLYDREQTTSQQFISHQPSSLPWRDDPQPDWSRTVKKMVYEGTNTLTQMNGPPISTGYRGTLDFQQHFDGWSLFKQTTEMQWQQQPIVFPDIASNWRIGNYWISPDALKRMQAGVIEENAATKTTLSYELRQGPNNKPLGYIVEAGQNNSFAIYYGYDLDDGALVHYFKTDTESSTQTESVLVGRE